MFHLLQEIVLHDKVVVLKTTLCFIDTAVVNKHLELAKSMVKLWSSGHYQQYNLSPGVWSQILPFICYNVQHNSSHNFSCSPNCNGWHNLSLSREMAEEQLSTWSYQPDLSLFLICTHATVTCALHMLRLHGRMLISSCGWFYSWLCSLSSGSSSCAFLKGKLQPRGWSCNSPAWSLPSQLPWLPRAPTFFAALFML